MTHPTGKRPARKGAIKMQFTDYVDRSALPTPPARFGHELVNLPWGMLSNDKYSCCVFAGAAHEHMVWTHEGGTTTPFWDTGVLADYRDVTGFSPKDPDTDQGTDMQMAASYRRRVGVIDQHGVRHKIDAYLNLEPGDLDSLMLATYLFGATGVGLRLPVGAMDAFDANQPWVGFTTNKTEGGHYVPCIGRNSAGLLLVVTWGRVHAMSVDFAERYCDEAVTYYSREILRNGVSPEGFDDAALLAHQAALTSNHKST